MLSQKYSTRDSDKIHLPQLARPRVEGRSNNFKDEYSRLLHVSIDDLKDNMATYGRRDKNRNLGKRQTGMKSTLMYTGAMNINSTMKDSYLTNDGDSYYGNNHEYFHKNDRWNQYTENVLRFGKHLRSFAKTNSKGVGKVPAKK